MPNSSHVSSRPSEKSALTPCETAFKEWLLESGGSPTPQQHTWLWQAFRAGWYAKQGEK